MKSFIGAVLFICVAFSANAQLLWKVSGNGLNQRTAFMESVRQRTEPTFLYHRHSPSGTVQHHG